MARPPAAETLASKNRTRKPKSGAAENSPRQNRKRDPAGGAAATGGINFQGAVTAIAGVHLLRGSPVGWLTDIADDTPVAVWAETNGPGDDIRIQTRDGKIIEVQSKKGLKREKKLWDALASLVKGIQANTIDYGVLVVAPDSSDTIMTKLSKDIIRLGEGRDDNLSDIAEEFKTLLESLKLPVGPTCRRLRIMVVHALQAHRASLDVAQEILRSICKSGNDAPRAWDAIYGNASAIIERKGRWELVELLGILEARKIPLLDDGKSAAGVIGSLMSWTLKTNEHYALPGLSRKLSIAALLPMTTTHSVTEDYRADAPELALKRYHEGRTSRNRGRASNYDADFTGLFHPRSVVVAGPGQGKSTLTTLLANRYSGAGYPVLRVSLKPVAASMRSGYPFEESLYKWGLDSSPVSVDDLRAAKMQQLVIIADGLDDCGDQHHQVASGLAMLGEANPRYRIIVTTRPIGYELSKLADWRHYALVPPDSDKGKQNLTLILLAAEPDRSIWEAAVQALDLNRASPTITSSPQMLGMAASLIITNGSLPTSRVDLYQKMIDLLGRTERANKYSAHLSEAMRRRVLEVLGWVLMKDPLSSVGKIVDECSEILAPELGKTSLATSEQIENGLNFWEEAGLIERLHHSGQTLITFVHKTFTEFTAALYVVHLDKAAREKQLEWILEDDAWEEVVRFAAGLGAGDDIAGLFAARKTAGETGHLLKALAILNDPDTAIRSDLANTLVRLAFEEAIQGDDEAYAIGFALAQLSHIRPDLVGPPASALLYETEASTRLVAWACTANAGQDWYDPDEIRSVLDLLASEVKPSVRGSILGGLAMSKSKDIDLLQEIGLAVLRTIPEQEIAGLLAATLTGRPFDTGGFIERVQNTLDERGLKQHSGEWQKALFGGASFGLGQGLIDGWAPAARTTILAVTDIMLHLGAGETPRWPRSPFFSAILTLAGFWEVPAFDVHAWTRKYSAPAVTEALRLLTVASGIDPKKIASDAVLLSETLRANPEANILTLRLAKVDPPELNWLKTYSADSDVGLLKEALGHRSYWLVDVAADALGATAPDINALVKILENGSGLELVAAAALIAKNYPDAAVPILVDCLSSREDRHLDTVVEILGTLHFVPDAAMLQTFERALMGDAALAKATGMLVLEMATRGDLSEGIWLEPIIKYWEVNEKPYPTSGGVVPESPRHDLLRTLLFLGKLSDDRLIKLLGDPRGDIVTFAKEALLSRQTASPDLRRLIIDAVHARAMGPSVASQLFHQMSELSREDRAELFSLFSDAEPKWRFAAMALLQSPPLQLDDMESRVTSLLDDTEPEIRQRAARMLKSLARSRRAESAK